VTSALLSAALQVSGFVCERAWPDALGTYPARQMTATGLSVLLALDKKAFELCKKGHYARAAETYDAAVLEAQALGQTNCLITATLQLEAAGTWYTHAFAPGVLDADRDAALNRAALYLRLAHPVLVLRNAAGTLQPSKCRRGEEVWNKTRPHFGSAAGRLGPFIGYDAFLSAAALEMQVHDFGQGESHPQEAAELVSFVVSAVDLVLQPQQTFGCPVPGEIAFVNALRRKYGSIISSAAAPRFVALVDAWRKLISSGVLSERGLDLLCSVTDRSCAHMMAAAHMRHSSAVLRTCALEACTAREVHALQFKHCGGCRAVAYCCREHQVADWPSHKEACKAARKAAAQSDAA
jgi:hypothetical protein